MVCGERLHTRLAIFDAFFNHLCRFKPEEDVEELIRISPKQRPGKDESARSTRSQRAERIALSCVSLQLVHFIGDSIVKKGRHVATDEIDRTEAANSRFVRLP